MLLLQHVLLITVSSLVLCYFLGLYNFSCLGLKYKSGNCGVSIVRSGESMEQGLRDCCRSIRIGKILVESDAETHEATVVYARFPEDISRRHVCLFFLVNSQFKY